MKHDTVLVVPTIREKNFMDFVDRWHTLGLFDHVDLVIMEDNPKRTFPIPAHSGIDSVHFDWSTIEDVLGKKSWIIPRRSDTVRSFAYWWAWKQGYKFILTLDDDCYPTTEIDGLKYDGAGFVNEHKRWLTQRSRWFNTLTSVKPRGIPFYNVGELDSTIVNHGLWTNVLDYDAPYQLANPIPEKFAFDNRIVPKGLYFPMCGMNVMWKNEATVLMYHLLQGQGRGYPFPTPNEDGLVKLPFDRFGDIWCGIFMKKIADHCGATVSTGMPYIRHERASNPFTNLKKEANGIEVNEKLWEYVDQLTFPSSATGFARSYYELGAHISNFNQYPEHEAYFELLGQAMVEWAKLFME